MEYPIDDLPFRGSRVYSLQAELYFIDNLGTFSPGCRKIPKAIMINGYLWGLEKRTRDFQGGEMSEGLRTMLRTRAKMRLDDISVDEAA